MAVALVVIGVAAYLFFVGFQGSRLLVHPGQSIWCFTPASEYGWEYEAINYEIAEDERLLDAQPDPRNCDSFGEEPGSEVVTADGIRVAGWYIPAGTDAAPTDPTVVLVHGHGNSKSDMLAYAEVLHERYNLVLFDQRNHGKSTGTHTTMGVREQQELRAILDWLEREKGPDRIGLFGISMGGVTAANVADDDGRVDALALDSTHASLANTIETRLRQQGYPLTLPGYLVVVAGTWLRTGEFVHVADPADAVDDLGDRPLLILQGGRDLQQGPENAEQLLAAAQEGGVVAELHLCPEAAHGKVLETCPDAYRDWLTGFFERAFGP